MKSAEEHAAWLAERNNFCTASDVAAVLGLSPHKTRTQVFKQKSQNLPGPNIDRVPAVMAGKHFESGVLSWHLAHRDLEGVGWNEYVNDGIIQEEGNEPSFASRVTDTGLVRHPSCAALAATPDALVWGPDQVVHVTEIKYVDRDKHKTDWAQPWVMTPTGSTNKPTTVILHAAKWQGIDPSRLFAPVYYWVQLQAQMACLNIEYGRIVVAFGQARADLDYPLDRAFESYMIREVARFWAEVVAARELLKS